MKHKKQEILLTETRYNQCVTRHESQSNDNDDNSWWQLIVNRKKQEFSKEKNTCSCWLNEWTTYPSYQQYFFLRSSWIWIFSWPIWIWRRCDERILLRQLDDHLLPVDTGFLECVERSTSDRRVYVELMNEKGSWRVFSPPPESPFQGALPPVPLLHTPRICKMWIPPLTDCALIS